MTQITAYVEYFGQFTSYQFPDDIVKNDYSEQWALACGEVLRVLTHYNHPIYKWSIRTMNKIESAVVSMLQQVTLIKEKLAIYLWNNRREPLRLLSPWITDLLLATPLCI